jgi:hypothetical protein
MLLLLLLGSILELEVTIIIRVFSILLLFTILHCFVSKAL